MEGVTNTLWAMNAYNGTCLWTRKLRPGFWVQRNTIIATPDVVYLGDDVSCKALDAATGALRHEWTAPVGEDSDRVWKWMGLEAGVLYGLLGGPEVKVHQGLITVRGSAGFSVLEYAERAWGFGRTLVAIRLETKEVLWHRREEALVDSRGRGWQALHFSSQAAKTGQTVMQRCRFAVMNTTAVRDMHAPVQFGVANRPKFTQKAESA